MTRVPHPLNVAAPPLDRRRGPGGASHFYRYETPVPPCPQYPIGFTSQYCW